MGGQALGRQRLTTDIVAVMSELGFERLAVTGTMPSFSGRDPSYSSGSRETLVNADTMAGMPHQGEAEREPTCLEAAQLSGTDIVLFQLVGGQIKAAILIATEDWFIDVIGHDDGRHSGQSNSLVLGDCFRWLAGEHRVRLELIRGMGWTVGVLPVEQWRKAGREGGRKARLEMMKKILPVAVPGK